MTTEPTPLVTVLPCDREAAADIYYRFRYGVPRLYEGILAGTHDTDPIVQIFAKYRLAALEAASDKLDARAAFLRTPAGRLKAEWHESDANMVALELNRQAAAIRALSNKGGEGSGDSAGASAGPGSRPAGQAASRFDPSRGDVLLAKDMFDFLMGAAPYDGTWFHEMNDNLPGRFWWRAILRSAQLGNAGDAQTPVSHPTPGDSPCK